MADRNLVSRVPETLRLPSPRLGFGKRENLLYNLSSLLGAGRIDHVTLKHFTAKEVEGLVEPLPEMLDETREVLKLPIRITSTTDGIHSQNSEHYKGLAADIGLGHLAEGEERDLYRYLLMKALLQVGFRRIEMAQLHFHVGIGQTPDYPSPILWLGQDT